jgi:putative hydrolase of the HAD superfamily
LNTPSERHPRSSGAGFFKGFSAADKVASKLVEVKGVFFDAGDTLFEVKGGVGRVYAEVAGRFGVSVESAQIQRRFLSAWKGMPPLVFPGVSGGGLLSLEKGWWRTIVEKVFEGVTIPDFDRFFDAVYAVFEGEEAWELFPETKEVLEDLKAAGYRLGVISNFDSRIFSICDRLQIRAYFDDIVISTHAGAAKPSPRIFQSALRRLSLVPSEALYVGDSPVHDDAGARAVGMHSVLIDRKGRHFEETGLRIKRLEELIDLLGIKKIPGLNNGRRPKRSK